MAVAISERCGGNPFYIESVVRQSAHQKKPIQNTKTLNEILAVDVTSGFIWGELLDQVNRWIERINDQNITKWILYLSSIEETDVPGKEDFFSPERIQEELKKREGKVVSLDKIYEILVKLSRGALLEELGGRVFRRMKDPILLDFLRAWGKIVVEGLNKNYIRDDYLTLYNKKFQKSWDEYKGYLAEVHLSQVLYSNQNKKVPGEFFHSSTDMSLCLAAFVRMNPFNSSSPQSKEFR